MYIWSFLGVYNNNEKLFRHYFIERNANEVINSHNSITWTVSVLIALYGIMKIDQYRFR